MLKRLLFVATLLTACSPFKPTGEFSDVRGRVFSHYFNGPLENATVSIPGYAQVRTDAHGYFEVRGLPTKWIDLEVTHESHDKANRPVHVEPYGSKYLEVWVNKGAETQSQDIVFERDFDIWVSDLYGSKQKALTTRQTRSLFRSYPVWSGDKKQIAYIAFESSQRSGIDDDGVWVMRADGSMPRKLTGVQDIGRIYHLDWSPDGNQFLFMLQDRIFIYNQKADSQRMLSGGLARPSSFNRFGAGPVWTADGQRVITALDSVDFGTNFRFQPSQRQIFAMDQQGGNKTSLTRSGDNFAPAVSHSGNRIAYVSTVSGHPEVWVMDLNGANPQQLTRMQAEHIGQLRWTSNDQHILFTSNAMQKYKSTEPKELWAVDVLKQDVHMVTNDALHADG